MLQPSLSYTCRHPAPLCAGLAPTLLPQGTASHRTTPPATKSGAGEGRYTLLLVEDDLGVGFLQLCCAPARNSSAHSLGMASWLGRERNNCREAGSGRQRGVRAGRTPLLCWWHVTRNAVRGAPLTSCSLLAIAGQEEALPFAAHEAQHVPAPANSSVGRETKAQHDGCTPDSQHEGQRGRA